MPVSATAAHTAPIRWGILGAGRIAHRFAASLAHDPRAQLVAISCRTQAKADVFAAQHPTTADATNTPVAYSSHEALLADPNVDVVYLALPHGLHCEWSIKAIEAGKAVLCEKPCCLTASEVAQVADAAAAHGVLFMEGMKTRFLPLYQEVKRLVQSGAIGQLKRIDTQLCNDMIADTQAPGTYLVDPVQGGALYDCGIYCVGWIEDYLKGPIHVTSATQSLQHGVDFHTFAELQIDGTPATLETGFDGQRPRLATLTGTAGTIVVEDLHRPTCATLNVDGQEPQRLNLPPQHNDFFPQIDHFNSLYLAGKTQSDVMPLSASIRMAQIVDAVRSENDPTENLDD